MSYLLYFPFGILIFFLYFLPGFFITRFKIFNRYDEVERIALSFLLSSLIFGFIGLSIYLLGFTWNLWTNLIPTIFLIGILFYFTRNKLFFKKEGKTIIRIFFTQLFIMLTFQIFIRYYPLGGDWMSHFDYARSFLSKDWGLRMFHGPPLYSFIIGYFLPIFGNVFWVAQIVSTLISTIYLIPSYLIAKQLFSKKIAWLTFFILLISPFMVESSLYTFPKNFTTFFLLICFYFLIKRKLNIWFGISAALAFLTHFYAIFFLISFGLFIIIKRKKFKLNKQMLIKISLPFVIAASVLYGYNILIYGEIAPNIIKYFPIAIKGWRSLAEKTTEQIWKEFYSYPFYYHIFVRIVNFAIIFVPFLTTSLYLLSLHSPLIVQLTHRVYDFSTLYPTFHYLQTFPGALSLLLFFFFLVGFIKLFKEKNRKKNLIFLTCLPVLFSLILYGWIYPILSLTLHPLVPIFVMIGFWSVFQTKNPRKWIKLIFLFAVIEAMIFCYLYSIHINSYTQQIIKWGEYELYEKYLSAYKLFNL